MPIAAKERTTLLHNRSSLSTTSICQSGSGISYTGAAAFARSRITWNSLPDALKTFAGTADEKADPADQTTADEKTADKALRGKHILLAEDNELNWEVARGLLADLVIWNEAEDQLLPRFRCFFNLWVTS